MAINPIMKLSRAVLDVPEHIDDRLVEVDASAITACCERIEAEARPTTDAARIAALAGGAAAAAGMSIFVRAVDARFVLSHFPADEIE